MSKFSLLLSKKSRRRLLTIRVQEVKEWGTMEAKGGGDRRQGRKRILKI